MLQKKDTILKIGSHFMFKKSKTKPKLPSEAKCCGCSACYASCPAKAISMVADKEGFLQPSINTALCIGCKKCEKACPILAPRTASEPIATYGVNARDNTLRFGSSSGGVFTVLANQTIANGGIVFGAGFEANTWRIVHKSAETLEQLDELRGSKYVQSDTGDTFKKAKAFLDSGRNVLYSGTPCQIAALKKFLGRDYNSLLTVDLICHGVPTPLAWDKYLKTREEKGGGKISKATLRRYCNWREYSIKFELASPNSPTIYKSNRWYDPYFISFIAFWSLRKVCFKCPFRNLKSGADITLGDYNNISELHPEMDDDKGSSVVIVSSQKGIEAMKNVSIDVISFETTLSHVIEANPSIIHNHKIPRVRKTFLRQLPLCQDFDALVIECQKLRTISFIWQLAWWIKRLIVNREFNKFQWK